MADNQTAALSDWDDGLLSAELDALKGAEPLLADLFDLNDTDEQGEVDDPLPDTDPVRDEFWITLSGPLEQQARALQIIRQALECGSIAAHSASDSQ